MNSVHHYLVTWNPPPPAHLTQVIIEDETLRDGLQAPYVRRPSLDQKIQLLRLSAGIGTGQAMIGFPSSSSREYADCLALLRSLMEDQSPIAAHFLGRPMASDLAPIAALQQSASWPVWADFWVNASPLRMKIEGWAHEDLRTAITTAASFLLQEAIPFCVSLEDATRTPEAMLAELIMLSLDRGAGMIAICDTAGEAIPEGAARLTRFVVDVIKVHTRMVPVLWHGHNDRGLALANALAATEAGAQIISGTLLGVGERAGNTPIEQVVSYLHQAGHSSLKPSGIVAYAQAVARCLELAIPDSQALVGRQTFATAAGTHAAAIVKALTLGEPFADYVFSGVPAASLQRRQTILVGPLMGVSGARHKLQELGLTATEARIQQLLHLARERATCLEDTEIAALFAKP